MGKSQLPDDFGITDSMLSWAAAKVPDVDVERETENFVDYWRAHGTKMADWAATWRMWMRRARHMRGAMRPPRTSSSVSVSEILRAREQRASRETDFESEFERRFGCKPITRQ